MTEDDWTAPSNRSVQIYLTKERLYRADFYRGVQKYSLVLAVALVVIAIIIAFNTTTFQPTATVLCIAVVFAVICVCLGWDRTRPWLSEILDMPSDPVREFQALEKLENEHKLWKEAESQTAEVARESAREQAETLAARRRQALSEVRPTMESWENKGKTLSHLLFSAQVVVILASLTSTIFPGESLWNRVLVLIPAAVTGTLAAGKFDKQRTLYTLAAAQLRYEYLGHQTAVGRYMRLREEERDRVLIEECQRLRHDVDTDKPALPDTEVVRDAPSPSAQFSGPSAIQALQTPEQSGGS